MFSDSIRLFSLDGFEIRLDKSWLLIAALITWSLAQQYFPQTFPDQTPGTYLVMGLFACLCFFGSLLLHELAHSVVARRFGIGVKSITLFLFGGVAELASEPDRPRVEFWIAVAGPAMSLFLAFGFWIFGAFTELALRQSPIPVVLHYLALINFVLALFNLVPAFPLDGGRILRAALWHRTGDVLRATETAARSGTFFAFLLMTFGVLSLFQGAVFAGFWYILIGGFVLMAARSSYQTQLAEAVFDHKTVAMLMTPDPVTTRPDVTLDEFVNHIMIDRRASFVPVVENGVLLGHMDHRVLEGIDRENWPGMHVDDIFAGLTAEASVAPYMPVKDLMALIAQTGRRKFMVVEDHRLCGVITLSDVIRYLRVSDLLMHRQNRTTKT
ncbi:site-2 protease family protein [Roseobacter ponti]|uniref:Zinc metalloprotease n=1 Tax=Roseobacter ponti TaxID=1891787 RepID=A0A858SVP8_9RHOB|nr:site-2 protease family protein [Roseobacter ponti]QJF52360.1 CBS domain-containing protein [Roseobacter ponti]